MRDSRESSSSRKRFGIHNIAVYGCVDATAVGPAVSPMDSADSEYYTTAGDRRSRRLFVLGLPPFLGGGGACSGSRLITAINKIRGSTKGGTQLVITGRGFGTDTTKLSIKLQVRDGNRIRTMNNFCRIDSIGGGGTAINCVTKRAGNAFHGLQGVISLEHDTCGTFSVSTRVSYEYVDAWSLKTTWGGLDPPVEGDSVHIPAGQKVVLDVSPPRLFAIVVQGELEFDTSVNLNLDAAYIIVNGGKLKVGTADDPFQNTKATITMHGHVKQLELPVYGTKVLAARNAEIDMHGRPVRRPWTRLASTASSGASSIVLSEQVLDWRVGDEIVIASTDFNPTHAEPRKITSIAGDWKTIGLNESLSWTHIAEDRSYEPDGGFSNSAGARESLHSFTMAAEVALLTRTVKFQGAEDSELPNEFGAHIMLHSRGDNSV